MTTTTMSVNRHNFALVAAAAGFLVTLALVALNLMNAGHAAFNTTSVGVFWGLPIVTYDYFLLTSTGLTLVASLPLVFGLEAFRPIARRCVWLAIAGLVGGVAALMLELGHPLRAMYAIVLSFQTASPLFWKVLFVAAHAILLFVLFGQLMKGDAAAAKPIAIAMFVVALGIALLAGSVYGMMAMRPFWFGGDVPVAFLIESFLGGLAFTIFFSYLAHSFRGGTLPNDLKSLFDGQLGGMFAIVIALHGAFVGGRVITGLWSNAEGLQVWRHITASPLFHIEVWLGIVLPLVLMAVGSLRRTSWGQIAASVLVMVSLMIARYDFIVGGQIVPLFKGSWAPGLISYVPSATEWLILLMSIFLANVVNAFGEWKFDLEG